MRLSTTKKKIEKENSIEREAMKRPTKVKEL